jgi:hypothetical protein
VSNPRRTARRGHRDLIPSKPATARWFSYDGLTCLTMQLLFGKGIKPGFQNAFIAVDLQLQDFANITHGLRTLTARACRTSQRPQRICLALQTMMLGQPSRLPKVARCVAADVFLREASAGSNTLSGERRPFYLLRGLSIRFSDILCVADGEAHLTN